MRGLAEKGNSGTKGERRGLHTVWTAKPLWCRMESNNGTNADRTWV